MNGPINMNSRVTTVITNDMTNSYPMALQVHTVMEMVQKFISKFIKLFALTVHKTWKLCQLQQFIINSILATLGSQTATCGGLKIGYQHCPVAAVIVLIHQGLMGVRYGGTTGRHLASLLGTGPRPSVVLDQLAVIPMWLICSCNGNINLNLNKHSEGFAARN